MQAEFQNALLIHNSETVLTTINDLAAIWPNGDAFLDACSTTKRAALVFNSEVSNVPWTWARVRWSFDTMVKEVKTLRAFAKAQAEAEPRPQAMLAKDGTVVYVDPQDAGADTAAQRREAAAKAAREELNRIKDNKAEREERKKNHLPIDLGK